MDATFVWVQCKFFFEVSPTLWLRLVSFVKGDARRATRLGEKTQQSEEANEEKTQQSEKTNEEKTQQSEKTNVQRLEKCNAQRLFKVPEAEPERQSVT